MKGLLMLAAILIILPGCGTLQSAKAPVHEQVKGKQVTVQTKSNPDSQSTQGGPSLGSKEKTSQDKQTETKGNEGKASIEKPKVVEPKPEYRVMKNNYIKPIGDADPKVVLLTIDDAPDDHAVEMAQTLKSLHAKAIFYIMGVFIDSEEGKAKLKKIQQMGFPVGDHTKSHPHLPDLSKADQETEIMSVYNNIENTLGKPPKFFRAPFGQNTDVSFALASKYHMLEMNWSYGYDWNKQYENPQALTQIMVNSPLLANGAILLMHDRAWTAKALPGIINGLRAKGYKILDPALLETPQENEK